MQQFIAASQAVHASVQALVNCGGEAVVDSVCYWAKVIYLSSSVAYVSTSREFVFNQYLIILLQAAAAATTGLMSTAQGVKLQDPSSRSQLRDACRTTAFAISEMVLGFLSLLFDLVYDLKEIGRGYQSSVTGSFQPKYNKHCSHHV